MFSLSLKFIHKLVYAKTFFHQERIHFVGKPSPHETHTRESFRFTFHSCLCTAEREEANMWFFSVCLCSLLLQAAQQKPNSFITTHKNFQLLVSLVFFSEQLKLNRQKSIRLYLQSFLYAVSMKLKKRRYFTTTHHHSFNSTISLFCYFQENASSTKKYMYTVYLNLLHFVKCKESFFFKLNRQHTLRCCFVL